MAAHETDTRFALVFELPSQRSLHAVALGCCLRCDARNDRVAQRTEKTLDPMAHVPHADR